MAKGTSKGGFKTFILLLIAIVGAFVLGIAAILLFSPNTHIFGLGYASNSGQIIVSKINNEDLNLRDYQRIVIEAQNADVRIACGTQNAGQSNFTINKNSRGFYHEGKVVKYSYSITSGFYSNGRVLTFVLSEPNYSFLSLTNSSTLVLNIAETEELGALEYVIKTTGGSVIFGGATAISVSASSTVATTLNVKTEKGRIELNKSATVQNVINFETTSGAIKIGHDISTPSVNLVTKSGRITMKNLEGQGTQLSVESSSSTISADEINGNAYVDTVGGSFSVNKVNGNLSFGANAKSTVINVGTILGNFQVSNLDGAFKIKIGEVNGTTAITTNKGSVTINGLMGTTYILSGTASLNLTVGENNLSNVSLTTGSGTVNVNFEGLKNTTTVNTESGDINMKVSYNSAFYLSAYSEKGTIYKVWEGSKTKGERISNQTVGQYPSLTNKVNFNSVSGNIKIERYATE